MQAKVKAGVEHNIIPMLPADASTPSKFVDTHSGVDAGVGSSLPPLAKAGLGDARKSLGDLAGVGQVLQLLLASNA